MSNRAKAVASATTSGLGFDNGEFYIVRPTPQKLRDLADVLSEMADDLERQDG